MKTSHTAVKKNNSHAKSHIYINANPSMLCIANISWHWMRSFINCLVNDIYNLRYACLLYLSILLGHVSFWYRIAPCYVRNQLSYAFVRSSSSRSSSPSSGQRLQGQKQPVYANDMLVNDINRLTKHEQVQVPDKLDLLCAGCALLGLVGEPCCRQSSTP